MILDSKKIEYEVIDISEPGKEAEKEFMQEHSTSKGATISDQEPRHALPPQIFSGDEYCGKIKLNFIYFIFIYYYFDCVIIDEKQKKK